MFTLRRSLPHFFSKGKIAEGLISAYSGRLAHNCQRRMYCHYRCARAIPAIQMPAIPSTFGSYADLWTTTQDAGLKAGLKAIEAVRAAATRGGAAAVEAVSVACAAVAVHGVAAVAGSVADDVALPAAFSHHQSFVEAVVGDLAPVFVEVSADLAPAWRTSSPAVAGISDLP
jgi:hypothetical protein